MLTYDMNHRNGLPIYIYLYHCIREDIISGRIEPHKQLPSKRALARHLDISTISVMNAYEQLLMEGYIYAIERKGYFAQNLENYRSKPSMKKKFIPETVESDPDLLVDFKANRISLSHFPASVWARYMREALSLDNNALLRPIPYNGLVELRTAISDYLEQHKGIHVSPAQIIIGAGTEYLYSRLLHLFGKDTILALENPGYQKFATIASSYGNRCVYIPIDQHGLRASELEKSDANIVHISPSNHFPTGIVMPITRRLELFEWVNRGKDRYIIEDDYDSEFRYVGKYILPMYTEDVHDKIIYMNTFSKTLVPSLRISYMILPPSLMKRYVDTLSFYSCTVSSFEQYALAQFIINGHFDRHLNRLRKHYKEQRTMILHAITRSPLHRIATIHEKNAGTHFLLEIKTQQTEAEISQKGLEQHLLFSFVSDYTIGASPSNGTCTMVFNYAGILQSQIEQIIQKLESIFKQDIPSNE